MMELGHSYITLEILYESQLLLVFQKDYHNNNNDDNNDDNNNDNDDNNNNNNFITLNINTILSDKGNRFRIYKLNIFL
jgi:hypothetical protein